MGTVEGVKKRDTSTLVPLGAGGALLGAALLGAAGTLALEPAKAFVACPETLLIWAAFSASVAPSGIEYQLEFVEL